MYSIYYMPFPRRKCEHHDVEGWVRVLTFTCARTKTEFGDGEKFTFTFFMLFIQCGIGCGIAAICTSYGGVFF